MHIAPQIDIVCIDFHSGMKEDDICELLKFERKQLRARISILKNDKFLQGRLKMETGPDGKAAKVTFYFINYKTFVNVVKYKLDWMRKRMETTERDATSRASFKCVNCSKTFTDLEVNSTTRKMIHIIAILLTICFSVFLRSLCRRISYSISQQASSGVHSAVVWLKKMCRRCRKKTLVYC